MRLVGLCLPISLQKKYRQFEISDIETPKSSRRAEVEDARARRRAPLSIFIEHAAMSIRCLF
jgi:hypothetical protein